MRACVRVCVSVSGGVLCFSAGPAFSFVSSDRKPGYFCVGMRGNEQKHFGGNNVEGSLLIVCFNVCSSILGLIT